VPFDPEVDYLQYVDGKPRMEGVKSFLESRNIKLPFGDHEDPPDKKTICGLGNRKNLDFQKVLRREGPDVFETSIKFLKSLKKKGIKIGVASSSKNCALILKLAKIENLFETNVDGIVSYKLKLKGKPDPDIFVTAAENLGLLPGECVVVEDAISGVQAGRNGNFGLTLGIARGVNGETLRQNGADIVVGDLSEITYRDIADWFDKGIEHDGWNLTYNSFDPKDEKLRETLCTVGNGYLGTRGCFEGERASDIHYPGTYIAGMYNKIATKIQGKNIYNNDFVNCPNWLLIEMKIGSGPFISPARMELLSYTQNLNMLEGVMERSLVCKDNLRRITRLRSSRIASMATPHICAIKYEFIPVNYSASIKIRSSLDGTVINDGVVRYRDLKSKHLTGVAHGKTGDGIFLHVRTNRSKYQIVMSAGTQVYENGKPLGLTKTIYRKKSIPKIAEEITVAAKENSTYTVEKIVSIYTSLDPGVSNPGKASADALKKVKNFSDVFRPHKKAWKAIWNNADIKIIGDRFVQMTARLHIYHLLVSGSPNNVNIDAGFTARGLHGEAYRGHIFWDELFILPFFNLHFPEITRALLKYRHRRLGAAKKYAKQNGYNGAMYPWQTADDGSEETQEVHYNPANHTWGSDLSRRQRHVSIAVFYNIWKYVADTGDRKFLIDFGAEVMLEIASGLKDNAYTNVMVVWLLKKALKLVEDLGPKALAGLSQKIGFNTDEINRWKDIADNLNVIITKQGIISQFDGYMDLMELDWNHYREKYGDIHRLDRIIKAEGEYPDKYKLAKQADVLMMFYVLGPEAVKTILNSLGYKVDDAIKLLKNNYEYYEARTTHGSTLSKVVHAVISGYIYAGNMAWDWFLEAMKSDIFDTQGGTTLEGIHCGVMASTLDVIYRYFAGIDLSGEVLEVNPHLPKHWSSLAFRIRHRKIWYNFEFTPKTIKVKIEGKGKNKVPITILGKNITVMPGETGTMSI
jgi:HAD superfamily hydrolase (TIGR01509 family)